MRFKVRTLLIAVALVALTIGAWREFRNRKERAYYANFEAHVLRQAAQHERELAVCKAHGDDASYDQVQREWALVCHFPYYKPSDGWSQEASWHADMVANRRQAAAQYAERKRDVEGRLLLP